MTGRVRTDRLARGAGRGFTVLVLGGLLAPVGSLLPGIGPAWLALVAVAAFTVAGSAVGDVPRPALHGAVAALCCYALVVPLVVMATRVLNLTQLLVTSLAALVVGALAGLLARRSSSRGTGPI